MLSAGIATGPAQAPTQPGACPRSSSTTNQESGTGEQPRLDSWKEIANYLRRSVRTVRRWEREEGLPVRRHYHGKQATIFALSAEIDEWLAGRSAKPSSASPVVKVNQPWGTIVPDTDPRGSSSRPIMIAVLPLRNLGGDPAQERFADGLTDELITEIGHCCPDRLRVIGLTSVMQYKRSTKTVKEIGRQLAADYVLEGAIRRYGRRVRLTARLLAARDQAHIWADSYETQLPSIFSLQQTLASQVADSVSAKLQVTPDKRRHRSTVLSFAAHSAYIEGRSHFLPTEGDSTKSIEHLNLAIERDPKFAPSYAELALAYFRRLFWDFPPIVTFKRIEEYASKALTLDPKLARAHSMLAAFQLFGSWSWSKAERSSRLAIKLNPSDPWAQIIRAAYHLVVGERQEAIEGLNRVRELDPQSQETGVWFAIFAYFARHYDLAIEHCREVLQLDPSSAFVHMVLGLNLAQINEYASALSHCEKALELSDRSISQISRACSIYALTGEQQSAERLFQELVTIEETQYTRYTFLAQAAVFLRKDQLTLDWLEKSYEQRDPLLVFLKTDPRFDSISANPRFRKLLGRIELPGEQERKAAAHVG